MTEPFKEALEIKKEASEEQKKLWQKELGEYQKTKKSWTLIWKGEWKSFVEFLEIIKDIVKGVFVLIGVILYWLVILTILAYGLRAFVHFLIY